MTRRIRSVVLAAALLGGVPAAASAAATPAFRGGTAERGAVCGATAPLRHVETGGALTLRVPAARGARVQLSRCAAGRWVPVRSIRGWSTARGIALPTGLDDAADLRARVLVPRRRAGRPVYARVGPGEIVDLPVSFRVVNRNRTSIPCLGAPDGATYTVHGRLVGSRSALAAGPSAATLYLHGLGYSSFFFHFTDVPGYDYVAQQAAAGHVSVIVDRLGNPAHDDLPDGTKTCMPAQADMADQMVAAMRAGSYGVEAGTPLAFRKVVLAGHSAGGFIAQVAQYSFGSGDALAVIGYNDVPSPLALEMFLFAGQDCLLSPRRAHGSTGAPGYAPFGRTALDFTAGHFWDIDPQVAKIVLGRRNLDPCGDLLNATQTLLADQLLTTQITKPVLVISGADDALFSPPTNTLQAARSYPGSPSVSLVELPDTGHAVTLGRTHEAFRAAMARWLTAQGS